MSYIDLGRVADLLFDQLGEPLVGSYLVRLVLDERVSGGPELAVRPLDGPPAEALAGFRAPAAWSAIGLVCGGWAAPMDGVRPSAHPDARRISQVILLGRDGTIASRVRYADGSVLRAAPASGAALDALRFALGLPRAA